MIRYHGGPITPEPVAIAAWNQGHAFVSFERPDQIGIAARYADTFALDNGAFSVWKRGAAPDWSAYREWVEEWGRHPGCDFAIIPDVIDGDEAANDALLEEWGNMRLGCPLVPVWHLHESIARLVALTTRWERVALGSSGLYAETKTDQWWGRMSEVMAAVCDRERRPPCKLHGLRMLDNTIVSQFPLASADSTNIARNHARYRKAHSISARAAATAMRHYMDGHEVATRWSGISGHQFNLEMA